MLYGEQWICVCGMHNFFQRTRCRGCGKEKAYASVGEESCGEVILRLENQKNQGSTSQNEADYHA